MLTLDQRQLMKLRVLKCLRRYGLETQAQIFDQNIWVCESVNFHISKYGCESLLKSCSYLKWKE